MSRYTEVPWSGGGEYFRVLSWIDRLPESVAQNSVMPLLREAAEYDALAVADGAYMDYNHYEISSYRSPLYPFLKALKRNPQLFHSVTDNYRSITSKVPGFAPLIAGELLYESGETEAALPKLLEAMNEAVSAGAGRLWRRVLPIRFRGGARKASAGAYAQRAFGGGRRDCVYRGLASQGRGEGGAGLALCVPDREAQGYAAFIDDMKACGLGGEYLRLLNGALE